MLQVLGVDLKKGVPYNSGCGTIKNPHCPMAMSADYIGPSPAMVRLRMSEKFSSER